MSDKITFSVPSDLRQRISARLPGATDVDFAALAILIAVQKFITDDGAAHPAFINWVDGIIERDGGEAGAMIDAPPPRPVPHSGFVGATA